MTQGTEAGGSDEGLLFAPESFWAIALRRTRYVIAACVSAYLFYTLGWMVAAPPPDMAGVSLLGWPTTSGLYAAAGLAGILLLATVVCTVLIHPDAPHMGLFCALLGMSGLSIRGGTVHMLLRQAMVHGRYPELSRLLALECVEWAILCLIAETGTRLLHERFFANTRWITRSGPDLSMAAVARLRPAAGAMGVSLMVSQALKTEKMRRRIATPLAMIYSGLVGLLMLYLLLKSPVKGQVFFACFTAFFLSTLCSYLAFPRVPFPAFLVTVPLLAAGGYLYGMNMPGMYPGYAGFFMARALPIDYVAAGIPGAILGYYGGFRWSLHSPRDGE